MTHREADPERAKLWAVYDETWQDYLALVRFASDSGCDIDINPPERPICPRPESPRSR
jgi:hypothetical protein